MKYETPADEEKMVMYMKLPKKKIIEMLIQCNKVLDSRYGVNENFAQPDVIKSGCGCWIPDMIPVDENNICTGCNRSRD